MLGTAEVSIQAPDTVASGEPFSITIVATGATISGLDLQPPSTDGVAFQGRTSSTSMSSSIVGGRRTTLRRAQVALSYTAFVSGALELGPFVVSTGSQTHDLGSVVVHVVADSSAGQAARAPGKPAPAAGSSRPIWLEAVPESGENLYTGMPFKVRYYLHSRYPLERITPSWSSPAHGVARLVQAADELSWKSEDGLFSRAYVLTLEMVPACPGSVLVPILQVEALAFAGRSPFGTGITLHSDSVRVPVLPIPDEGRPENFAGTAGELAMDLQVINPYEEGCADREIRLSASGPGAFGLRESPRISISGPADLRRVGDSGQGKRREWSFLLVPEDSGTVILGPDSLGWLDPTTGGFRQAVFGPETLQVTPGRRDPGEVVLPPPVDDGGIPAVAVAGALVALVTLVAAVMVLRSGRRDRRRAVSDARDPYELLSALESQLSRMLTGEEGYIDGRELDRLLSARGVDRIAARSVVSCWKRVEALVSGTSGLSHEDLREEAVEVVKRLEKLLFKTS